MSTIPEGAMWVDLDGDYWRAAGEELECNTGSGWFTIDGAFCDVEACLSTGFLRPVSAEPTDHRTPSDGPAVAAAEPTPAPAFMVARPEVHGICTVAPFGARQIWGAQA